MAAVGTLAGAGKRNFACGDLSDGAAHRAVHEHVEAMRRDLAGPDPSAVERLLVERALVCWAECERAGLRLDEGERAGASLSQAAYLVGRYDRAHARFLSACKALAAVRRLDLRGVVLNVATNQQVNLNAPESPR